HFEESVHSCPTDRAGCRNGGRRIHLLSDCNEHANPSSRKRDSRYAAVVGITTPSAPFRAFRAAAPPRCCTSQKSREPHCRRPPGSHKAPALSRGLIELT